MRQIKFRAWDDEYKDMIYSTSGSYNPENNDSKPSITICPDATDPDNYTWFVFWDGASDKKEVRLSEGLKTMQHTGLKDIAGIDAYEQDIVKAVWSEDINDEIFGIGRIIFNCGCFMIEWIDDPEANMELLGMIYKTGRPRVFQILGNEFQNPELVLKRYQAATGKG